MSDRYFSSNPAHGGVVSRFGTGGGSRANTMIGARRDPRDPRRLIFTDEVVAIPAAEYARFRREYDKAVRNQSLLPRTAEDYRAYLDRQAIESAGEAAESDGAAASSEGGETAGDPPAQKRGSKGKSK